MRLGVWETWRIRTNGVCRQATNPTKMWVDTVSGADQGVNFGWTVTTTRGRKRDRPKLFSHTSSDERGCRPIRVPILVTRGARWRAYTIQQTPISGSKRLALLTVVQGIEAEINQWCELNKHKKKKDYDLGTGV